MDPNLVINRILRLARLDTSVFDEVRDDAAELIPALVVAGISALLAGLGAFLFWEMNDYGLENTFLNSFILGAVFMAALYAVWILVTYVMLVQVFKAQSDPQSLFRTMGYAAFPLAASVLMFIPVLHPVFAIVPLGALLLLSVYAVQATTNADSSQVVMADLIGFAVFVLVLGIVSTAGDNFDAPMGAGLFAWIPET